MGTSSSELLGRAAQLLRAGRLLDAKAAVEQLLAAEPRNAAALYLAGVIQHAGADLPAARATFLRTYEVDPAHVESRFMLGLIHQQQQEFAAAISEYRSVLARDPNHAKAANNLGRALIDAGEIVAAVSVLRELVARHPNHPGAHQNLGDALRLSGDWPGAVDAFQRGVQAQPNSAGPHANLGAVLSQMRRSIEAIAELQTAARLDPQSPQVQFNLARALQNAARFDDAIVHVRRAVELAPNYAEAWNVLGNLLGITGDVSAALGAQTRAIEIRPDLPGGQSNRLLSLNYLAELSPTELFDAHVKWARRFADPQMPVESATLKGDGVRPLRVGYVSPDFRSHSVAYFVEGLFAAHDPTAVEVFCYASVDRPDATTRRLMQLPVKWRDIWRLSNPAAAELIRRDQIDVLVDLAGHTANNRLGIFSLQPAPVQMTYLGYPTTTGMKTMQYRITDAVADPPGQNDHLYTERLIRIEGGAWAYTPATEMPAVGPLPAARNGFITLGSFNNLPKITSLVLEAWKQILLRVPTSRLLMKSLGLGSETARKRMRQALSPVQDRIELLPWTGDLITHLDLYNRVDIALDTFPYNGTTTTCEALWMGVPVVTLTSAAHAGRVGASLLSRTGLQDWIATSIEQYVNIAQTMAEDRSGLTALRMQLRQRAEGCPLIDSRRLARELENAYRHASEETKLTK